MRRDDDFDLLAAAFEAYAEDGTADCSAPAFYVETDGGERIVLTTSDVSGKRTRLSECTPAEQLIAAVEIDYTHFRDEVMRLWKTYPFDGMDRTAEKENLTHLSEEVREISELLRANDPLGYFFVTQNLEHEHPMLDSALASEDIDLSETGARLLNILEAPAHTQVRLRNVFEVAFDGMERATQREQYEQLASTYPSVVDGYYPARRIAGDDAAPLNARHIEYRVEELDDLYRLLLTLHFSQVKQRIARCECCFGYFIPKTKRQTLYCDRRFNGKRCKDIGPDWQYKASMDRDTALKIYDTLRHRRALEYNIFMNGYSGMNLEAERAIISASETWSVNASAARKAYMAQEIDTAEFLRRIEYDGELKASPLAEQSKSEWRKRVERSIDFDPWLEYSNMMTLDLTVDNPQWGITPAAERMEDAQGEHRSLQEKYGKKQRD